MKHPYFDRFQLVMSDPMNGMIHRVPDAGTVRDGCVTMHNGLKVTRYGYSGVFSDILVINGGVHEPTEEYAFQEITRRDSGRMSATPVILELGSYWAFYSMCFLRENQNGTAYLVDESAEWMSVGMENFKLNDMRGNFKLACVGNDFEVDTFVDTLDRGYLDVLHADIQAAEFQMLLGCFRALSERRIGYIFLSTHTHALYASCKELLDKAGYITVCCADMDRTFCCDGLIVARSPDTPHMPVIETSGRGEVAMFDPEELERLLAVRGCLAA